MARWQIMKAGVATADPVFDDGLLEQPGDDGFAADAVKAHVASLTGGQDGFNYMGPSTPPPADED